MIANARVPFPLHIRRLPPQQPADKPHNDVRYQTAQTTGPFDLVDRQACLDAFLDLENLAKGAQEHDAAFDLGRFVQMLRDATLGPVRVRGFYSSRPGDARHAWQQRLADLGVLPLVNPLHGGDLGGNVDSYMIGVTCGLITRIPRTAGALVGSGDGNLVRTLAYFVHASGRRLVTASIAGSTNHALDARHNPWIAANIEIGEDCLVRARPHLAGLHFGS